MISNITMTRTVALWTLYTCLIAIFVVGYRRSIDYGSHSPSPWGYVVIRGF